MSGVTAAFDRLNLQVGRSLYHAQPKYYNQFTCDLVADPASRQADSSGTANDGALWPSKIPDTALPGHLYASWDPAWAVQHQYTNHGHLQVLLPRVELFEITINHPQYSSFRPTQGGRLLMKTPEKIDTTNPACTQHHL